MKTIKVKYIGFWNDFNPKNHLFTKTILENYNVIESDNPDYIICSCFFEGEDYYEYCNYNQVRIMYAGENYIPDFNLIDYAISPYPIDFQDRHFRFPMCFEDYRGRFNSLLTKDRNYTSDILTSKSFFANFIYSHESEDNLRSEFFRKLSKYKRIESCGSFLNNQVQEETVTLYTKSDFQHRCKFTLCFESTKHEGFITEKITDAFFADTIPIYYGSSDIKSIFNEEAFIYCGSSEDFDEAIRRIIELDQNDDLYLRMLRKPVFKNENYAESFKNELNCFIHNIFDQPLNQAYRRSRVYAPKKHEAYILCLKISRKNLLLGRKIPDITDKQLIHSFKLSVKRIIKTRIKHAIRRIHKLCQTVLIRL